MILKKCLMLKVKKSMSLNRSKKRRHDPTGQASRRRKATRALDRRLNTSEGAIKILVRDVQSTRRTVTPLTNQETVVYDYQITPAQLTQLEAHIRAILDMQLETEGNAPMPGWFWVDQIEPPYRQGTMEEVNRINQLIAAAILAGVIVDPFVQQVPIEQVLQSREYNEAIRRLTVTNYGTIKSLSERTSSQVIQQINSGISAGNSPADISKAVSERFDVSHSNAKRIADTEINRAYNDAKLDGAKLIEKRTGQRTGVLHISALLPTTRDDHADRHGKSYTVEDQFKWWETGANRINCKCSTSTVLIDGKGDVVQTEDQATLQKEREFFER